MKIKKIVASILTVAVLASCITNIIPTTKVQASTEYTAYSGTDLGATYTKEGTTFKVWAPTASKVEIKRYKTGSDSETGAGALGTVAMTKDDSNNVWSAQVSGDLVNTYYTYSVTVNGSTNETPDVYGRTTGINGDRSMVIDLDSTDPEGWSNDKRVDSPNQTDAVVWEVHVKDFSSDPNSGISAEHRGKYLAFTEQGTSYKNEGNIKTGIAHLKELGVTHVQILPMFDYASVDETSTNSEDFNWGYDPKNYNVPEGSYSTNPNDGNSRVTELKQMVKALHDNGIGVVMDVVYNHTYAPFGQSTGTQSAYQKTQYSPLERTVPGYYYTATDWSGCGNSLDSTKAMYRKYMIDSMVYWATEYHLDGFRFDLMGIHDVETINQIRAALNKVSPTIKLWGEPWCGDGTKNSLPGYGNKSNVKALDNNVAVFSDNARDAIKGNTWDGKLSNAGYVTGNANRQTEIKAGIKAMCGDYSNVNSNIWSKQPSQVLTYTSCHDNHALYDILALSNGTTDYGRQETLVAENKVSAALVLTSQGISFMQAGEEFCRTKYGDHNSYQSKASVNRLDWSRLQTFADVNSYYSGLINIRKNFSAFRDPTYGAANRIQYLSTPSSAQTAYTLTNTVAGEWSKVACLFNVSTSDASINVPGDWVIVANDSKAGVQSLGTASESVNVKARSAMILVDKTSFNSTVIGTNGTVITKYVDKETGAEIATSDSKSGKEGTDYTTSPKTIDNYAVSGAPSNATGKFTDGTLTVTYQYVKDTTPSGTVTVKYINSVTNQEIGTADIIKGKEGADYSISEKAIAGYVIDDTAKPTNSVGKYTAGNTEVVYYYYQAGTAASSSLKVSYNNPSGWTTPYAYVYDDSTTTTKEFTGKWPGTAMKKQADGSWYYELPDVKSAKIIFNNGASQQEPSGQNVSGYVCSGDVEVKDGKVIQHEIAVTSNYIVRTKYIDSVTKKELKPSTVQLLAAGQEYTTSASKIDGYEAITTPSNANGKIVDKNVVVIYEYKLADLPEQAIVKVLYVDADTDEEIADSVTLYGNGGVEYQASKKDITGYTLSEIPADEKGVFTSIVTIRYKYKKNVATQKGTVTVKYVDKDTNTEISDATVLNEIIGTVYKTYAKEITGYTLAEEPTNNEGKFTEANIVVTYKYSKNSETQEPTTEDPKELTILSFAADLNSKKEVGQVVNLAVKVSGGSGKYQYGFQYYKDNKWVTIRSYSESDNVDWTPTEAGDYEIYAMVRDGSSTVPSNKKLEVTIATGTPGTKSPDTATTTPDTATKTPDGTKSPDGTTTIDNKSKPEPTMDSNSMFYVALFMMMAILGLIIANKKKEEI